MSMPGIWLTRAAEGAYLDLQDSAPATAASVAAAISDIPEIPGEALGLPGAPPAEPFLIKEPLDPDAPAILYRRATPDEEGDWLVVSLLDRDDYRALRQAEQDLAAYPPPIQGIVRAALAGTVSALEQAAPPPYPRSGAIPADSLRRQAS